MIPIRDASSKKGFAPLTLSIAVTCAIVFVMEIRSGGSLEASYRISPQDIYNYLVHDQGSFMQHQLAILVSAFMHGGYLHFFGNMLFLGVFGPAVEKKLGVVKFFLLYLLGAYAAFYVHAAVFSRSAIPVIGASGAISAVMGAYLVLNPRGRILTAFPLIIMIKFVELPSSLFIIGWFILQSFNGYLSLSQQNSVAWFAHIGGFAFGLATGFKSRWT